jgi:hypothetical protein
MLMRRRTGGCGVVALVTLVLSLRFGDVGCNCDVRSTSTERMVFGSSVSSPDIAASDILTVVISPIAEYPPSTPSASFANKSSSVSANSVGAVVHVTSSPSSSPAPSSSTSAMMIVRCEWEIERSASNTTTAFSPRKTPSTICAILSVLKRYFDESARGFVVVSHTLSKSNC